MTLIASGLVLASCGGGSFDPSTVADANGQVQRVEPLSWWVGMKTPLQILVQGEDISSYNVSLEGGSGISLSETHKADNPNFLFLDVKVAASAQPGTCYLVFSKDGEESFKYPYEIAARAEGSAQRGSFTTADMIYLLMPDRFANGDPSNDGTSDTAEGPARDELFGRHGGDIQGIIDHLDYIADLGATAIWSTPLLLDDEPGGSYHGYACGDYYHIDPRYGSNELYRELVDKAHEKGLKIIMDVVTNHCGAAHWWMKDMPFPDWVHTFPEYTRTIDCFTLNMDPNGSKHDLDLHEGGWFDISMPDMNLDNPYVLKYFQQWAVWWAEYAGLDGFRVDTYPYNEKEPMSRWCQAVLNEYPNFNIVGECWIHSPAQLAYWQGGNENKDGFDSHLPSIMDFPLLDAIGEGVPRDSVNYDGGMKKVYDMLANDFLYHDLSHLLIFPGNHDTERIGDIVRKNPARLKIVMAMMATMRGIPQIFAGDEMMFTSKDLSMGHGGLRVDFPGGWEGDEVNLFTPEGRAAATVNTDGKPIPAGQMAELHDYFRTLFQWRKGAEVIHSGKTLHFLTRDNTYAYFRYNDSSAVFVYINNSRGKKTIPWSNYSEITDRLSGGRNVLTGEATEVSDSTIVPARGVLIVEYNIN